MKTAQELIDQINAADIYSVYSVADEMEDEMDWDGVTEITTVEREEHRWYVLGTVVFKIGEEFFGVRGVVSLKSESMAYSDVGHKCEAFIMHQVPTVTYKRG